MTNLVDPALDPDAPCTTCRGISVPCLICNSTGRMSVAYDRLRKAHQDTLSRLAHLEAMLVDSKVRLNSKALSHVKCLEQKLEWIDGALDAAPDDKRTFQRLRERRAVKFALEVITALGEKIQPKGT